jgi:hypothetical protein
VNHSVPLHFNVHRGQQRPSGSDQANRLITKSKGRGYRFFSRLERPFLRPKTGT